MNCPEQSIQLWKLFLLICHLVRWDSVKTLPEDKRLGDTDIVSCCDLVGVQSENETVSEIMTALVVTLSHHHHGCDDYHLEPETHKWSNGVNYLLTVRDI